MANLNKTRSLCYVQAVTSVDGDENKPELSWPVCVSMGQYMQINYIGPASAARGSWANVLLRGLVAQWWWFGSISST